MMSIENLHFSEIKASGNTLWR